MPTNDPNGAPSRPGRPVTAQPPSRQQPGPSMPPDPEPGTLAIDCATCPVRGDACDDCLVTVLLGPPHLDRAATQAITVLTERGLVPPLRDPRGRSARAG